MVQIAITWLDAILGVISIFHDLLFILLCFGVEDCGVVSLQRLFHEAAGVIHRLPRLSANDAEAATTHCVNLFEFLLREVASTPVEPATLDTAELLLVREISVRDDCASLTPGSIHSPSWLWQSGDPASTPPGTEQAPETALWFAHLRL